MCSLLCDNKIKNKKGYKLNVRQYFCVKNRENNGVSLLEKIERERKKLHKWYSCVKYVYVYVCTRARVYVCVLCETMIFVHILKCIPAQYRHDEDAEDALALGRRRVRTWRNGICICRHCLCPPTSIKSNLNPSAYKFPKSSSRRRRYRSRKMLVPRSLDYDQTYSNRTKHNSNLSFVEQRELKARHFLSGCDDALIG